MTGTKIVKLKLEGGTGERLPKLMDSQVSEAVSFYNGWSYDGSNGSHFTDETLKRFRGLDFKTKQLQEIVDILERTAPDERWYSAKAGYFSSALMRGSTEKEFRLNVRKPLDYFGNYLSDGKKVTVYGDLGDWTGRMMEDAHIIVKGNAGGDTGNFMDGGSIDVKGNAERYTGSHMTGGRIHVYGNAGDYTGDDMEGGRIEVGGTIGGIGTALKGGEIWHRGERVWPKEE
ncbi:MAG: hypothetical protein V1921_06520 [Candidatus Altiarchaeota archaeon]